jgi:CubicO group peptidase (beta-lactamase class C family)
VVVVLLASCTDVEPGATPSSVPSAEARTPEDAREAGPAGLQGELAAWVGDPGNIGVTAAIATADRAWAGAYGVDGAGEPLSPEMAVAIGSITKTFTAAEVLLLARRDAVDLDAPVTDYVRLPFDTQGATVRDLLSMRSGFPDPTGPMFAAAADDMDRSWTPSDVYSLVDTSEVGQGRNVGDSRYNNLNYIVLGEVIEAVSGWSYASAVRRDLILPARLDRVWVQDAERPAPPVAAVRSAWAIHMWSRVSPTCRSGRSCRRSPRRGEWPRTPPRWRRGGRPYTAGTSSRQAWSSR